MGGAEKAGDSEYYKLQRSKEATGARGKLLETLDADHDGAISTAELVAGLESKDADKIATLIEADDVDDDDDDDDDEKTNKNPMVTTGDESDKAELIAPGSGVVEGVEEEPESERVKMGC